MVMPSSSVLSLNRIQSRGIRGGISGGTRAHVRSVAELAHEQELTMAKKSRKKKARKKSAANHGKRPNS
jgi:hypothetical protein